MMFLCFYHLHNTITPIIQGVPNLSDLSKSRSGSVGLGGLRSRSHLGFGDRPSRRSRLGPYLGLGSVGPAFFTDPTLGF